jgi:hypothetical protein
MYERDDDIKLRTTVVTSWRTDFDGEEHREIAEELDVAIDGVLDLAIELSISNAAVDAQSELIRIWSVGRAVKSKQTLNHPAMLNEYRINLWRAMEQKALLGIRSDGTIYSNWTHLRSHAPRVTKRPDRHLFEVGLWIQHLSLTDCAALFLRQSSLASELFRRPAFRSLKMRSVFHRWIVNHDQQSLDWISVKRNYVGLAKRVVKRWPARGPGSAKRPEHYSEERLYAELKRVLDPVIASALDQPKV